MSQNKKLSNINNANEDVLVVEDTYVHLNFDDGVLSTKVSFGNDGSFVPLSWLQKMIDEDDWLEVHLKFSLSEDLIQNAIDNWAVGKDRVLEEDKPMFDALRAELTKCISMLDKLTFVPERNLKLEWFYKYISDMDDVLGQDAVNSILKIVKGIK